MVCTGHHVTPLVPTFKDQHKFKGTILHTHSYKKPDGFEDKTVVVVGIGNSGGDVVVELSSVARKVYLSKRRGTWIVPRVGPDGKPIDVKFMRRYFMLIYSLLPYDLVCSAVEWYISGRFNHEDYQLKPEHRVFSQYLLINDELPFKILSGSVIVKPNIDRFTENGVIFEGMVLNNLNIIWK
jgi:dimethylaniline monooxygenase (N-oxide forming)